MNLIFSGKPGSGKGTNAAFIGKKFNLRHISPGFLLSEHLAKKTKIGIKAESFVLKGNLVSDDIVIEIVSPLIIDNHYILDGFPRNLRQAEWLHGELCKRKQKIRIIHIDAPDDILVKRMLARGRPDDNEKVCCNRLDIYRKETLIALDFLCKMYEVSYVDGTQSIDKVNQYVLDIVGKL